MKVWVLTEERNEYDQYGEYFLAVFQGKPTLEQLSKHIDSYYCTPEHVLNGGGRTHHMEDVWYFLREVDLQ